ncbi:tetratricopeptide repeat protein [Poriferisphaera sp. WC338]|uniref:tetratricopeptide repeat protein n=1 Tax=Poriferisphaera sp. WC338 TaxID=3425129 RepID=UPI003D8160AE
MSSKTTSRTLTGKRSTKDVDAAAETSADLDARNAGGMGIKGWQKYFPWLLVLVGTFVYLNTFENEFVLDSIPSVTILGKLSFDKFMEWLLVATRPVADLTVWLNAQISGQEPWSYRLTNVAIHLGAGLFLYGIVRRTLKLGRMGERLKAQADIFGFVIAILFVIHPLQTQSVAYMIQRHESLMGLCYLGVIYSTVRLATVEASQSRMIWIMVAMVLSLVGMLTKQVMVTAPIVAMLFDRCFITGDLRETLRKRWRFYGLLCVTWVGILWTFYAARGSDDTSAGFSNQLYTPMEYLLSQGEAILNYYLRLAFWPRPLVLDYGIIGAYKRGDSVWLWSGLVVGMMLLASMWGLIRNRWWGFCGMAFFLILAPTSSIMPIADVVFEHRMYLPLIVVIVLAVFAVDWMARKLLTDGFVRAVIIAVGLGVVVLVFSLMTIERNTEYTSRLSMWTSVAQRVPENPRAWHNLGKAQDDRGMQKDAVASYKKVLALFPNHALTHNSMGKIMIDNGQVDEAIGMFGRAIELNPKDESFVYNMGRTLWMKKDYAGAATYLQKAIAMKEDYPEAHNNLGMVWVAQQQFDQAEAEFAKAIEADDQFINAYYNDGMQKLRRGLLDAAEARFVVAEKIDPARVDVQNSLGQILAQRGELEKAWARFVKVNQIAPDYVPAIGNMATVAVQYAKMGKQADAIMKLQQAIAAGQAAQQQGANIGQLNQVMQQQLKAWQ